MSSRIPDTHAEAWALLPWLANGRLGLPDREWVEAHMLSCAECRAEFDTQRELAAKLHRAATVAPPEERADEQRSFDKLWARVEASEAVSASIGGSGTLPAGSQRTRTVRWLAAAVIVQALGLGVLGVAALRDGAQTQAVQAGDSPDNGYSTVAAAEPSRQAPALRIVFAPDAQIATVNTLLTHQGLTIVSGPGRSGNFTAELSADAVASGATAKSVAAVIARDPNVSFAQPVAR
jgi:anti-sigma factor RsiW